MKTLIYGAALALLFIQPVFGEQANLNQGESEKFYVHPNSVHVNTHGIFVELEGNFIPVKVIGMDEGGMYAMSYNKFITCPKCGKEYDPNFQSARCPHITIFPIN